MKASDEALALCASTLTMLAKGPNAMVSAVQPVSERLSCEGPMAAAMASLAAGHRSSAAAATASNEAQIAFG